MSIYLAIFFCSICWSSSTQIFGPMGKNMPMIQLNFLKGSIALILFTITALLSGSLLTNPTTILNLAISGILGFGIGDLFLFYSLSHFGPSRTLILGSFQPFLIALQSYFLLGLNLSFIQLVGIGLMVLCAFLLAQDKKKRGEFSWKLLAIAVVGIFFDGWGVTFSKAAFLSDPTLNPAQANVYRVLFALIFLYLINLKPKHSLALYKMSRLNFNKLFLATLLGNFLSLWFYTYAISKGNPAIVAALAYTFSPVMASTYEHVRDRVLPNKYFLCSLGCTFVGAMLLLFF